MEPLFTSCADSDHCGVVGTCEACRLLLPDHGHLNKVASMCARFAGAMFQQGDDSAAASGWGYLAGLWHDLGKFPEEWQAYLLSKCDPHEADVTGKLDHATAGARFAVGKHWFAGQVLAYVIASHHSGLLDATTGEPGKACLDARLKKRDLPEVGDLPGEITSPAIPPFPPFLGRDPFSVGFFTRMLFSCLVDADFLATEAFMNPGRREVRNRIPDSALPDILELVEVRIRKFGEPVAEDVVAVQRKRVAEDCRSAASWPPGLFTLTVPTGGGKTLSSLVFALRHAIAHGKGRVIFVVPFASIIEQNAEVIRSIVDPLRTDSFLPLIEHHSNLSPEHDTERSRLAAENWDAPIIITTAVQFYESLFAAKTSRCRKLHNIANSVVILEEAQTLPVDFLSPCLRVLRELSSHYQTTVVLCTATQPAIRQDEKEFPIGLDGCREIIRDTSALFDALKRVEVAPVGRMSDAELAGRLAGHQQVLCIVNRRKHAQVLFSLLGGGEGNFHLSALMCPAHRLEILRAIRGRLRDGLPIRVVSTQLIEAGVDVDFPVVYRSLAGLDSIAQAAGRCNRNGRHPLCQTYVFEPEDDGGEAYFRDTAQVAKEVIGLYPNLLGEDAIRSYFDLYYYRQKGRWDSKGILEEDSFRMEPQDRSLPLKFQYKTVAEKFRLIDGGHVPVIVDFDGNAHVLIEKLRNPAVPLNRDLLRGLQRYTVQIRESERDRNIRSLESVRDAQFHVLVSRELNYSDEYGLNFDDAEESRKNLII
jgi:CRISPR-associated endonuclease/helicase Cas3